MIFRLQYSIERISVDIGDMSTIQCALYSTFVPKYTAQYLVHAMPSLVPFKSNVITFLDIQASIFFWTDIRRYWWNVDNSMRAILHICCQIQGTISGLRYVKSGPVKSNIMTFLAIQSSIFNWTYLRCYCWCIDKSVRVILHTCCEIQGIAAILCYVISGPGKMQYNYNSSSSGYNIPLNVNPKMMAILQQFKERYTPHSLSNTEHNIRFTLYQIWSQSNPI
jgi:hypothetical protein